MLTAGELLLGARVAVDLEQVVPGHGATDDGRRRQGAAGVSGGAFGRRHGRGGVAARVLPPLWFSGILGEPGAREAEGPKGKGKRKGKGKGTPRSYRVDN